MFVKAILNEDLRYDYLWFDKGEEVYGNCRSFNQDFITTELYDDSNSTEENDWMPTIKPIRIKVVQGSIKRLYCGCNQVAVKEVAGEFLCKDCEYEEPEDHSYLCQTPFEF